jgi:hypothetical protein
MVTLMMEAVTSVYFNEFTRRCVPEGCLHTRRRENLKFHRMKQSSEIIIYLHHLVWLLGPGISPTPGLNLH